MSAIEMLLRNAEEWGGVRTDLTTLREALAEAYAQALEDYEAQGSYAKRMGRFPDNPYKEES